MYKLLRYFSIVSFVAIVMTVIVLVVLTRQMSINQLMELTTQQNIALARSFSNALWLSFEPYFIRTSSSPQLNLTASPETEEILKDLKMLSKGLPVVSIKIYNTQGITIFSPQTEQIGQPNSDTKSFIIATEQFLPTSVFSYQEQISGFSGPLARRDLIKTYVPVKDFNDSVVAIAQLYSDVTTQMRQIEQTQTRLIKALLLSFMLLYIVLFFIVRRADDMLRRQHRNILHKEQTIRRKSRELEQEVTQRAQAEQALQEAQENLAVTKPQPVQEASG